MLKSVMEKLEALSGHSSEEGALTRIYLSPAHRSALGLVETWMREARLDVHLDDAATLIGRRASLAPGARTLLLGSHIDTVRNGGKYDGNLGVAVAIEALRRIDAPLPFHVEVLAFGDEEGVRFPATLAGSRALAGQFNAATLDLADASGITLRTALLDFGCNPERIGALGRDPATALGYVEVHIEQGPVLEAQNLALGLVTAISGASRFTVNLTGMAGHAGTVPMALRRDAAAGAAEAVLSVERIAKAMAGVVATVGRLEIQPGAVNVIAGRAQFTLDVRSPSDQDRRAAIAQIEREFGEIAARRGLELQMARFYDEDAAVCDSGLAGELARAVSAVGIAPFHLPSGAGHDGLAMAKLCPFAMLFVRCTGGISHHPAEAVLAQDVELAVEALVHFVRDLDLNVAKSTSQIEA